VKFNLSRWAKSLDKETKKEDLGVSEEKARNGGARGYHPHDLMRLTASSDGSTVEDLPQ
jgi:hypothetical protein